MKTSISMEVIPKTIYTDIVDMPSPMLLGITIHYYNHSDENLYMKIFGSGPSPWSSNAVELGLLNSGSNAYINLDNFMSRTKPTSATTEVLTLTLRGYSDSEYSILKHEFSRSLTVIFIKSDDGSWTTDILNNFDDGTVQGWAAVNESGNDSGYPLTEVKTDYVLSTPYSCGLHGATRIGGPIYQECKSRFYKSFTTPNKDKVFAIFNLRYHVIEPQADEWGRGKYLQIKKDADVLVHLGKAYDTVKEDYIPKNKWIRIVVPLPKNIALELRIVIHSVSYHVYSNNTIHHIINFDDFKILSK